MNKDKQLLTPDEVNVCQLLASEDSDDGRRAAALLAIQEGQTQAQAAQTSGLTTGQVGYFVRKYREKGLEAFTNISADSVSASQESPQLGEVLSELDELVDEMQGMLPEESQETSSNSYSPVGLLLLVRDGIRDFAPDIQIDILSNFQDMTAEDLMDIDTWKGMIYMMTYSARFQASKTGNRVWGTLNEQLPGPVQPDRIWGLSKRGLNKVTPDIIKQVLGTFEGATKEDLIDPDTWKGLWYMLNYSLQFRAEELKQRLIEADENAT